MFSVHIVEQTKYKIRQRLHLFGSLQVLLSWATPTAGAGGFMVATIAMGCR
jgi:hypothetical protein